MKRFSIIFLTSSNAKKVHLKANNGVFLANSEIDWHFTKIYLLTFTIDYFNDINVLDKDV